MAPRDGNRLTVGRDQIELLRGLVRPYARRNAEVTARQGEDRWIVRGGDTSVISPISYSRTAFRRNFVPRVGASSSGSGSERFLQCGWDLLIQMDRAFEVEGDLQTDLSAGERNDYLIVAQNDSNLRSLHPSGVLVASSVDDLQPIGDDPIGGSAPDEISVFVSYRRPATEATERTAQLIQQLAYDVTDYHEEDRSRGVPPLKVWWDKHIGEGADWGDEITHKLASADLVVLLVDEEWADCREDRPRSYFVKEERLALANRDLWAPPDRTIGPHWVLYLRVDDAKIPDDVLARTQTTLTVPSDGGRWNIRVLVDAARQAYHARTARLEEPVSLASVLGSVSRDADASIPVSRVEPSAQRRTDAPTAPWLFVASPFGYSVRSEIDADGGRAFRVDEAVAASDGSLVVTAGQRIGGPHELLAYETDGPGRTQWRWPALTTSFQEDCRLEQGQLLAVERFGREYWLLWKAADMTWAARFDRSGVVWGERLIHPSAVRSAIAATSLPVTARSPAFVAVSASGLPLSASTPYPDSWSSVFDRFDELHEIRQASARPIGGTSRAPSISVVGTDLNGVSRIVVFDPSTGAEAWSARSATGRFERHQLSPDGVAIAAVLGERLYQWAIPEGVDGASQ